jgi:hypothetical protein
VTPLESPSLASGGDPASVRAPPAGDPAFHHPPGANGLPWGRCVFPSPVEKTTATAPSTAALHLLARGTIAFNRARADEDVLIRQAMTILRRWMRRVQDRHALTSPDLAQRNLQLRLGPLQREVFGMLSTTSTLYWRLRSRFAAPSMGSAFIRAKGSSPVSAPTPWRPSPGTTILQATAHPARLIAR